MSEVGRSHDYYDGYDLISGYLVAEFVQENIDVTILWKIIC